MDWTIHSTVPFPLLERGETRALLAEHRVGPEIYLSAETLDSLTPARAGAAAEALGAAGISSLTFHAPFEDLSAGARDEEARRLTVRRLKQAIALAPLFRPAGIVMHGGYSEWMFDFQPDRWLALMWRKFVLTWNAVEIVDTEENIQAFLPAIDDAIGEGLATLEKVEVRFYRSGKS